MSIAVGWPSVYYGVAAPPAGPRGDPARILQALPSPTGRYFAVLSTTHLSSRLLLDAVRIEMDRAAGDPVGIVWAPPSPHATGNTLALCSSNGWVYLYVVERSPEGVKGRTNPTHAHPHRVTVALDTENVTMRGTRITCVATVGTSDAFMMGAEDGAVVWVSWDGVVLGSMAVAAPGGAGVGLVRLEQCPALGLVAAVFADGSSVLLTLDVQEAVPSRSPSPLVVLPQQQQPQGPPQPPTVQLQPRASVDAGGRAKKRLFPTAPASQSVLKSADSVCIAFNTAYRLVTVGCRNGDVELFSTESGKLCRRYTLSQWGLAESVTGAVSALVWSPDGSVLAVGWSNCGLSIWSLNGCRLHCSATTDQGGTGEGELLRFGTEALCWVSNGYSLVVCERGRPQNIVDVPFFRCAASSTCSMHSCERAALVSQDRIALLTHRITSQNSSYESPFIWTHLLVPQTYLAENWPVKMVSMDSSGQHLAVAGTRGAAVYNCGRSTWKLFGDRSEELSIRCCGLCWFQDILVIANALPGGKYELLFFPADHLATSSLLARTDLPKKPAFIDCNSAFLVAISADYFLYQFHLMTQSEDNVVKSIEITKIKQMSMAFEKPPITMALLPPDTFFAVSPAMSPHISLSKSSVSSPPPLSLSGSPCMRRSSSPPLLSPSPVSTLASSPGLNALASATRVLVLDCDGVLSLRDTAEGKHIVLGDNIEQFWTQRGAVWAYGGGGLQMWYLTSALLVGGAAPAPVSVIQRGQLGEFDDEVYPVGVVADLGAVVGVAQLSEPFRLPGATTAVPAPPPQPAVPHFTPQTKSHPFLHSLLFESLATGGVAGAVTVAKRFRASPFISHSLELMLFEALESKSDDRMASVVKFLRRFTEYDRLVMRCARKVDVSAWGRLFSFAGNPTDLFQSRLDAGDLHTAASYLRIVLETAGEQVSMAQAAKLLALALQKNDTELAVDVIRFGRPLNSPIASTMPPVPLRGELEAVVSERLNALRQGGHGTEVTSLERLVARATALPR
eukprot:m51a1_g2359 hypothetical protein (1016) ;mRNA; f:609891-613709